MLKPVEKQRVADGIVDQLRALILTGEFSPKSKLPPERELARQLHVNRASLREALKKLEHMGLVSIRQGDGTRVADFMSTGGIELVMHLMPLALEHYPDLASDVLEFRAIYARELARLAATRRTEEDLAKMREIAGHAAEPHLSNAELFQLDFDFHLALAASAKNRVMQLAANRLSEVLMTLREGLTNGIVTNRVMREHHRGLLAALEAHDVAKAISLIDSYMEKSNNHARRLMDAGQFNLIKP